jgi:hypothetical protein
MRIEGPKPPKKPTRPILRSEIEEAQRHTLSNMAAAKYLGRPYLTYRKYAKLYGLFEKHLNPTGVGIEKGIPGKNSIPLTKIFNNEYPKYSLNRLKHRMLARKMLVEECSLCKFHEKRITDGKCPVLLTFKNGKKDYTRSNLILLCYNCMFLTSGVPVVAHRDMIAAQVAKAAALEEDKTFYPDVSQDDFRREPEEDHDKPEVLGDVMNDLKSIQDEVLKELGR